MSRTRAKMQAMRVLYVAVQNSEYPRNRRIREYLVSELNSAVDVIELSPRPGFIRHSLEILAEGLRKGVHYDMVVLAELSVPFAMVSWLLAKRYRALHVVDFFIGQYETHVEDRSATGTWTLKAGVYRALDTIALRSADIVLVDTQVRADALVPVLRGRQTVNLPVGAPAWAQPPASEPLRRATGQIRLLYYGNYIPLHGVGTLIQAFEELRKAAEFKATMVGDGEWRQRAEEMVEHLGLGDRVEFRAPVQEDELSALITDHDVVLGIFGTSKKASGVIANKVWQGLASGKTVVTRTSPALQEIAAIVGSALIQVEAGSPSAIAEALKRAANHRGSNSMVVAEELEEYVRSRYQDFAQALEVIAHSPRRKF